MKTKLNLELNQTILLIGDSITDAGRLEAAYKPLGYGYVHFVANRLLAKYPELNLNFINTGISGNSISDLQMRWEKDCLDYRPDILSVLIGINDVCRQYYDSPNEGILLDEYELTYRRLLLQVREKNNCQIVLMEPFLFCDDIQEPVYKTLKGYINTVNQLAEQFDAFLVPLQNSIDSLIQRISPKRWSDDMVHPYLWAHAWIAQRWLEAVGL